MKPWLLWAQPIDGVTELAGSFRERGAALAEADRRNRADHATLHYVTYDAE